MFCLNINGGLHRRFPYSLKPAVLLLIRQALFVQTKTEIEFFSGIDMGTSANIVRSSALRSNRSILNYSLYYIYKKGDFPITNICFDNQVFLFPLMNPGAEIKRNITTIFAMQ